MRCHPLGSKFLLIAFITAIFPIWYGKGAKQNISNDCVYFPSTTSTTNIISLDAFVCYSRWQTPPHAGLSMIWNNPHSVAATKCSSQPSSRSTHGYVESSQASQGFFLKQFNFNIIMLNRTKCPYRRQWFLCIFRRVALHSNRDTDMTNSIIQSSPQQCLWTHCVFNTLRVFLFLSLTPSSSVCSADFQVIF